MKIGVIGKGVVGSAVYDGLRHIGHDVSFFDTKYPETSIKDVLDTECVFVSVPTDMNPDGSCDTTIVEQVASLLYIERYAGLIAIKSTVAPGTCDGLQKFYPSMRFCSVPEFLRAKTALADFIYNHDVLVVGSRREEDYELIKKIHGNIPKDYSFISPTEAELVKYFNNVNHSVQIVFANLFYDISKKLDSNYDNVYNTISKRTCFNPAYLTCNENMRGFGGHCLPKDTEAVAALINALGLNYTFIDSILSDNEALT